MPAGRRAALTAILVVLATLAGCTGRPPGTPRTPPPGGSSSAPPAAERVYVSLGDSYATGYRPAVAGAPAGPSREGFADLVAAGTGFRLVNVACTGATSGELRDRRGCPSRDRALGAPDPAGSTQLDAAVRTLRAHEGRVGLVTVVIGGNDLTPCALAGSPAEAVTCASDAVAGVTANLAAVLPALRDAAGDAPIIGMTYPDVFLGAWVSTAFPDGRDLARASVPLFRDLNAAVRDSYEGVGATFVDLTEVTGGYGPLAETTRDPTYGPVPAPVARICALTHFCSLTDVHPTPAGHRVIADAVLAAAGR